MNIQTARCTIRAFQRDELDAFMEYRNDLEWMRYQGLKGLTKERYEQELFLNQSLDNGRQYAIINRTTGQLIGDVYLKREQTICWIGYTIHPHFKQQGYAQEAVRSLICWASEQGYRRLKAGVHSENKASIKLLEKLDFAYLTQDCDELIYVYDLEKELFQK
ncbi:MAG: GNAT family N-acetyltransferase [Enterococcus sp.]